MRSTETPLTHVEQNVIFGDPGVSYSVDVSGPPDPIRSNQDTHDTSLSNFFARPIKVQEINWVVGGNLSVTFNPWDLFFTNPRVVNRLTNYNLLRCKLHVKFMLNGNGFYYSRALASYTPFHGLESISPLVYPSFANLIMESQRPHVFINPTQSTGGELILPFLWHKNNLSIVNTEWEDMGTVTIRTFDSLRHANGGTDPITISVFVWAEDVHVGVLTSVDTDAIIPQMAPGQKSETDEANESGTISRIASNVAAAAGALRTIPEIAPMAMATQAVAGGISTVARQLGYSRPVVTRDPEPARLMSCSSLALTTVPDTLSKLTIDDKQELTVDPTVSGLNSTDPLLIKNIAQIEALIAQFDWALSSSVGTHLFNVRVSPMVWFDAGGRYFFPPTAVASMPFKYWTGTLKYRFQILSSAYHRGRLQISYDPNWVIGNEMNTMYTKVVDISHETDFTMEITNGQPQSLLDMHDPATSSYTEVVSPTRYVGPGPGNGVLSVQVLNKLTTPSDLANDIMVNVFISAGDDFKVFTPEEKFSKFVYVPQSGIPVKATNTDVQSDEVDQIQNLSAETLGEYKTNANALTKVFIGEEVHSFRQLLKRYNKHTAFTPASSGMTYSALERYSFPYLRGNVPGSVDLTVADADYSYCNTLLLHFIRFCFAGWRGSIRYKFLPNRPDVSYSAYVSRYLPNPGEPHYSSVTTTRPTYTTLSSGAYTSVTKAREMGHDGIAYFTPSRANPALEFEVPFYSKYRFVPGREYNLTTFLGSEDWMAAGNFHVGLYTGNADITSFDIFVAAGEDFNVFFWMGCPPMYVETSFPLPAV